MDFEQARSVVDTRKLDYEDRMACRALMYSMAPKDAVFIVTFGAHGTQLAQSVPSRGGAKYRRVRLWRKASGRWTNPRRLFLSELVRFATPADIEEYAPDYGRAWEKTPGEYDHHKPAGR